MNNSFFKHTLYKFYIHYTGQRVASNVLHK